jgi:hypothetical protein
VVDRVHRPAGSLEADDQAKVIDYRNVGSLSGSRSRHVVDCLYVAMSVLLHANTVADRMSCL